MGHDLAAAGFHLHAHRAVNIHLASVASRLGFLTSRQRQNPLSGGHFHGWATLRSRGYANDRG